MEHRIGDRRIIRLIRKRLTAGVMENGVVTVSDQGTGQGAVMVPERKRQPSVLGRRSRMARRAVDWCSGQGNAMPDDDLVIVTRISLTRSRRMR